MSWKLVSMRLNAVVCELAMLPEMFSKANDCARIPVTAVVSAPKIPMTFSPLWSVRRRNDAPQTRSLGQSFAKPMPVD
jgi:hypothetical protein